MLSGLFGNARLERTLNGVAGQVIGSIMKSQPCESFRFPKPRSAQPLQAFSIHFNMLPERLHYLKCDAR